MDSLALNCESKCVDPGKGGLIADIHTHLLGVPDFENRATISPDIFKTSGIRKIAKKIGPDMPDSARARSDTALLSTLSAAERVDYMVLHALDPVYKNGKEVLSETCMRIPNGYVSALVRTHSRLLFGASVHPYRDAAEMIMETDRCIDEGAVLFQWIPSLQGIDPEDVRCIPFYLRLAKKGIPLLCHTGNVGSSCPGNARNGDPGKMTRALDIGVKVIFSHRPFLPPGVTPQFGQVLEMLSSSRENGWENYLDTSSLCGEEDFLQMIRSCIDDGTIEPCRLVFGSGFPMVGISQDSGEKNPLDTCYEHFVSSGLEYSGKNSWDLLKARI